MTAKRARGLVLYGARYTYIPTVREFVGSIGRYSRFDIRYMCAIEGAVAGEDFGDHDFLFISYCCVLRDESITSSDMLMRIKAFRGVKVLTIQDEYDNIGLSRRRIRELGIDIVLTCVAPDHIRDVYLTDTLPDVTFLHVLPGYMPELDGSAFAQPLRDRRITLGYRGRDIGFGYGELSYLKLEVGKRFRAACESLEITHDIDWTEESRIYGDDWYRFVGSCRATLGTESGSDVFDEDGRLRAMARAWQASHPDATFEEFRPLIAGYEVTGRCATVGPRVFEAAILRTPMALVEGDYAGVLEPVKHYIPIRRDFSNVNKVLEQLQDLDALESMAERVYQDVVLSGRYTYRQFVARVDDAVESMLGRARPSAPSLPTLPDHPFPEPALAEPLHTDAWLARREPTLRRVAVLLGSVEDLPGDRPVYLYGRGRAGRLLAEAVTQQGLELGGFVESHDEGSFMGTSVMTIKTFAERHRGNTLVLASASFVPQMVDTAWRLGLRRMFDASRIVKRLLDSPERGG
jgi:hypothetical protein